MTLPSEDSCGWRKPPPAGRLRSSGGYVWDSDGRPADYASVARCVDVRQDSVDFLDVADRAPHADDLAPETDMRGIGVALNRDAPGVLPADRPAEFGYLVSVPAVHRLPVLDTFLSEEVAEAFPQIAML